MAITAMLLVLGVMTAFSIVGSPTVTAVAPVCGNSSGGTLTSITGTNFTTATAADYGGTAGTGFHVVDDTHATVTSPSHAAGAVHVHVTNTVGTSANNGTADQFTFEPTPTVTAVSPTRGPAAGGTTVTVTGSGFTYVTSAASIQFGGTPASGPLNVVDDNHLTVVSPAGNGVVDVTVQTCGGTSVNSANSKFTYAAAPTVTHLQPATGPATGGTSVTISGTGFWGISGTSNITSITFGGHAAAFAPAGSDTQVTATAPAYTPGDPVAVDVIVTTADGGPSAAVGADKYTYAFQAPTITSINPTGGPVAGGTVVSIVGTGFLGVVCPSDVKFGLVTAQACTVTNDTHMSATSPAQGAGSVHIVVTNHTLASTPGASDAFLYVAKPTVTSLSPSTGPEAGGTSVDIHGTGFLGGGATCNVSSIKFGTAAATVPGSCTDTVITVNSPAKAAADGDVVDVVVKTVGGSTDTSSADRFTYVPAPTITTVSPSSGPTAGGTAITISGSGFLPGATVTIGGAAAAVNTVNDSTITATTGAHPTAGTFGVTVANTDGQSATKPNGFTYVAPPAIDSLSVTRGPVGGGTNLTITGSGFQNGATVTFDPGGTNSVATAVNVVDSSHITLTTPAHAAGAVGVRVTNPDTQSVTQASAFTYVAAPTVTLVSPNSGNTAGGDSLTITGTGFFGGTGAGNVLSVTFGGTAASSFTVTDNTHINALDPVHAAGTVDVRVTTDGGTSPVSTSGCPSAPCDQFTYIAPPVVVSSVTPSAGPTGGGNPVHVNGSGFTGASSVKFGGVNATSYVVNNDTDITAVPAAHAAGLVDVSVSTVGGTGTGTNKYRYVAAPTVTGLGVSRGPASGGTSVVITGTGFRGGLGTCDVSAVKFGNAPVASVPGSCTDTSITVTSPAQVNGDPATVDVVVTTEGGSSATNAADHFTYVTAPTVTGLSVHRGPATGGTAVTISGTGFQGGTGSCDVSGVLFGTANATVPGSCTDTSIDVVSPAKAGGDPSTVDVVVTTGGGASATSENDHFSYVPAPTVTGLSVHRGPVGGGTAVTITGTGFRGGTGSCDVSSIVFGTANATIPGSCTDTSIAVTSPAKAGGDPSTVDVVVTTLGGASSTGAADQFTYVVAPTVTGIAPTKGPVAGGTSVVISGTGFRGGLGACDVSSVTFGTAAVGSVPASCTDTSITVTSPAKAPADASSVDVVVSTAGGPSATSSADVFTYVAPPTVTGMTAHRGPVAGGTLLTVSGTGFMGGTGTCNVIGVAFGTAAATPPANCSDTSFSIVSPAHTNADPAAVHVIVTTDVGSSAPTANDLFTYVAKPTVTAVSPNAGSTAGGNSVTVTGTGFFGGTGACQVTSVAFGSAAATGLTGCSDSSLTVTAPARGSSDPSLVNVRVGTDGGLSDVATSGCAGQTTPCDQYTFGRNSGHQLMVANKDGRLEVFGLGSNGAIWHAWEQSVNGSWGQFASLGAPFSGAFTGDPAVGINPDGRLEVFATNTDGNVYHSWQNAPGGGWTAFYTLGHPAAGGFTGIPSVATNTDGRLELFSTGPDGRVYHAWQGAPGGGWTGWYSLGLAGTGQFKSDVAPGRNGDGRLEIAAVDAGGAMWHAWQTAPSGSWSFFYNLSAPSVSNRVVGTPGETTNRDGRLEITARGTNNEVWHIWQTAPSGGWGPWYSLGGNIAGDPTVGRNGDGRLEVFATQPDGTVMHMWQTAPGAGWTPPQPLPVNNVSVVGTVQVGTDVDGKLEVLAQDLNYHLMDQVNQTVPGGSWTSWHYLFGSTFLPY
jgi:hypothetical protein